MLLLLIHRTSNEFCRAANPPSESLHTENRDSLSLISINVILYSHLVRQRVVVQQLHGHSGGKLLRRLEKANQ